MTKASKKNIEEKVERFSRQLRVELTEKELAERADRAAHVLRDRDGKEADRKAANTAAKSQIEELEAELRRLSGEVRDKATYTTVECERVYDYKRGRVAEIRCDTDELLNERAMRDDERQLDLDMPPSAATAEAKKLGDAVVNGNGGSDAPPPKKSRKAKGNGRGKGRSAEARA